MREAKHFFLSQKGGNSSSTVYFQREENCVFTFIRWLPVLESSGNEKSFRLGTRKKNRSITGSAQVIVSVRMKIPQISGEGGGGGLFTKHKILRTRTIYDFVGVTRTRVWRIEYRLIIVGIRRTRKRGYRLMKFHT